MRSAISSAARNLRAPPVTWLQCSSLALDFSSSHLASLNASPDRAFPHRPVTSGTVARATHAGGPMSPTTFVWHNPPHQQIDVNITDMNPLSTGGPKGKHVSFDKRRTELPDKCRYGGCKSLASHPSRCSIPPGRQWLDTPRHDGTIGQPQS